MYREYRKLTVKNIFSFHDCLSNYYMQIQQKIINRVYKQIGKNVLLYVLTA